MRLPSSLAAITVLGASLTTALPHPTGMPAACSMVLEHGGNPRECFNETHTHTGTKTWSAPTSWATMTDRPSFTHPDFSRTTTYSHVTAMPPWVMGPPPAAAKNVGPIVSGVGPVLPGGKPITTDCKTLHILGEPTVICDGPKPTAHNTLLGPGLPCVGNDCPSTMITVTVPNTSSKSSSEEPIIGTLATYGVPGFSQPGFTVSIPVTVTKAPEDPTTTAAPHNKRATSTDTCTDEPIIGTLATYGIPGFSQPGFTVSIPVTVTRAPADPTTTAAPHNKRATSTDTCTDEPIIGTLATYGIPGFSQPGWTISIPVTVTKATEHPVPTTHAEHKRPTTTSRRPEQTKITETVTYTGPSTTATFTNTVDITTQTFTLPGTTVEVTQSLYEWPTTTTIPHNKRVASTDTCTEEQAQSTKALAPTTSLPTKLTVTSTFVFPTTTATFTDILDIEYATVTNAFDGATFAWTQTFKERPTITTGIPERLQTE